MDSTVWVNGHMLGTHPYGYTPFAFDITPRHVPGEQNVITVRVNAQETQVIVGIRAPVLA